jgi:hypothetical protein
MAMEYGSSPVQQPALHSLMFRPLLRRELSSSGRM